MRRLVLLRPEPGLSASMTLARSLGVDVVGFPLFEVRAVAWAVPDAAEFDLLLLSSANALRFGGTGLHALRGLPVAAVGAATAKAAADFGFEVRWQGNGGVGELTAMLPRDARILHLAGRDRTAFDARQRIHAVPVYAAEPIAQHRPLELRENDVVALHSARAAQAFAMKARSNGAEAAVTLIALSREVGDAAGPGWADVRIAEAPTDAALLALGARLCLESGQ